MENANNLKKVSRFISILAIVLVSLLLVKCEKEEVVPAENLPQSAQQFLTEHFSEETIAQVVKEKEWNSTQYEVTFSNGVNIDFSKSGNCTSMESNGVSLPHSAIPTPILEYLENQYSNSAIVEWDMEEKGQTVELENDLEVLFDQEGNFLRLDD